MVKQYLLPRRTRSIELTIREGINFIYGKKDENQIQQIIKTICKEPKVQIRQLGSKGQQKLGNIKKIKKTGKQTADKKIKTQRTVKQTAIKKGIKNYKPQMETEKPIPAQTHVSFPAHTPVAIPFVPAYVPLPIETLQKEIKQGPRKTNSMASIGSEASGPTAGIVDVVFVVDTTGSMDIYLEKTVDTVNLLVKRIKDQSKAQDISVRFGFVAYRDHPPEEMTYLTKVKDLSTEREILKFIESLDCQGGGDGAEAVFDGLNEAAQSISWRNVKNVPSLRYIFHICDQPPHGDEYGGYSYSWGAGCPCGLKIDKVAHRINLREIHYRLIKASQINLEKMSSIFKSQIVNYDETVLENGVAEGMEIRISDMVIRELLPDYCYDD